MIYDARTSAGLSQSEPAQLIGSKQPVIARLEDADYEGHSLTMLQRLAAALNSDWSCVLFRKKSQRRTGGRCQFAPGASSSPHRDGWNNT